MPKYEHFVEAKTHFLPIQIHDHKFLVCINLKLRKCLNRFRQNLSKRLHVVFTSDNCVSMPQFPPPMPEVAEDKAVPTEYQVAFDDVVMVVHIFKVSGIVPNHRVSLFLRILLLFCFLFCQSIDELGILSQWGHSILKLHAKP